MDTACKAIARPPWTLEEVPLFSGSCPSPPAMRDLASARKLALSVFHFNIQYVAGGLTGFPDNTVVDTYNLNEVEVEDLIIKTGLEPLLDIYLEHPTFHGDVELQAYMVEVIAKRHPTVLEKMRLLAGRGQIDFDSFHYSDQLYVAYPRRDLEVSLDLVKGVFDRVCLPVGRSIFTQEGQFARGQLGLARDRGYRVSVLPKNLFGYQFGEMAAGNVLFEDAAAPGHAVLIGGRGWRSGPPAGGGDPVEIVWTFMDDGEVAFAKSRLNPYFGRDYQVDRERVQKHIDELMRLEEQGFVHATIAEAAQAMDRIGVARAPLPPVLDGTWQPKDTNNLFRWMGGAGLFRTYERDSDTLAAIWRASAIVGRADAAARRLGWTMELGPALLAAWREALLAQVSDSTGWNPWRTEVEYSNAHAKTAIALGGSLLACMGQPSVPAPAIACELMVRRTLGDLGAEVRSGRRVTSTIRGCASSSAERIHQIEIDVPKLVDAEHLLDASEQESNDRNLELRFAAQGPLELVEALQDRPGTLALEAYAFDSIGLPLANGLIGLGGGRYVIQEHGTGRVAALIARRGPDSGFVRFVDNTVSRAYGSTRRWYVLESAELAFAQRLANAINRPSIAPD